MMRACLTKIGIPLSLLSIVIGIGVGLSGGFALAKEITCSHVNNSVCQGSWGDDIMTGWENPQYILADAGNDAAYAYGGNDEVFGDQGLDNVNGGEGQDFVFGGQGADSYWVVGGNKGVYGQSGGDYLYGGEGEDFLEGNYGSDQIYGNEDKDVIMAEDGQADAVNGNGSNGTEQPCYVDGYDSYTNCTPH